MYKDCRTSTLVCERRRQNSHLPRISMVCFRPRRWHGRPFPTPKRPEKWANFCVSLLCKEQIISFFIDIESRNSSLRTAFWTKDKTNIRRLYITHQRSSRWAINKSLYNRLRSFCTNLGSHMFIPIAWTESHPQSPGPNCFDRSHGRGSVASWLRFCSRPRSSVSCFAVGKRGMCHLTDQ